MKRLTQLEFQNGLVELLKSYRDGDLPALSATPLLRTPLFGDILFLDEPPTPSNRHELTSAVLQWGMAQLKPAGEPDRFANIWRHYHVLHGFYLKNRRVADLAEQLGIADQTFYEWRAAALAGLARILYRECYQPADLTGRRRWFWGSRLGRLKPGETAVLTAVVLVEENLQWRHFFTPDEQNILRRLADLFLLRFETDKDEITQPKALKRLLRELIPNDYQAESQIVLYQRFRRFGQVQPAVAHAFRAGLVAEAVRLVIEQEEALFAAERPHGLSDLLGQIAAGGYKANGIDIDNWSRFMMIAARAAKWEDDLDLALAYGREALGAADLEIKMTAYYQRAKNLSRVNLDACLSHYAICFDLFERALEKKNSLNPVVTRMYIDRAWIFIQDRPDYPQADSDLSAAEALIPPADSFLWCDLYNARAELVARTDSAAAALPFHLKALTSAEASGDIERMTKMAYMVGLDYMFSEAYEQAREYLEKSYRWAERSGNVQTLAVAHKGLGGCWYFLGDIEQAIEHYLATYDIWHETGNRNWLANVCYDLAEGHATVQRFAEARRYFDEGVALTEELELTRFAAEFEELKTQFPALAGEIGDREARVLAFIEAEGGINRQQYMALTGVGKSQAYRDLNEMCESGLIERVGVGRGTKYIREGDNEHSST